MRKVSDSEQQLCLKYWAILINIIKVNSHLFLTDRRLFLLSLVFLYIIDPFVIVQNSGLDKQVKYYSKNGYNAFICNYYRRIS